jgi:Zn-finger nucleic acid-binding protein
MQAFRWGSHETLEMNCPRCSLPMQPGLPHTFLCSQCEGCWVDKGSMQHLTQMSREVLESSPLAPSLVADAPGVALEPRLDCPECHNPMARRVYCGDSGVVIDRCREHGMWFDDGELAQAVEHVQKQP